MFESFQTKKFKHKGHYLKLRNIVDTDFEAVKDISTRLYATIGTFWAFPQFQKLIETFPLGQLGVEDKGKIVAFALSIVVNYARFGDDHTYHQITGNFTFNTHDSTGDVLYGIEVCVDPNYQGMRLGRRLYDARKELCETLNLHSIIAGGRMPNYKKYNKRWTPKQYIQKVKDKEVYDPVLSFQLSNGFHVKKVLTDYLPIDTDSKAYATLIEWHNIFYTAKPVLLGNRKTVVRLGVVQWEMRSMKAIQNFYDYVEFFVDAVSNYKADFVVFPEYFNAPLMAEFNEVGPAKAIRELAQYTEEIRSKMMDFALAYNINIIAGSLPIYEDGKLYNAAYLCRRDGTWDYQRKIHITPSEVTDWGMQGGDELKVFQTDVGKIGILICYDVEFPELSRILAERGVEILFVPFATDTQNGYHRVRHCAQSRAIENECYVVIAGSVGNLPKVVNMDIQYAQSAVFSPSDFAFPNNAIVAEATANSELTLIADLDMDLLKELHSRGSVRNLKQRRKDLYSVEWLKKDEKVKKFISS